jgi:glycosyltransferase involved in cell wall biosynthesis
VSANPTSLDVIIPSFNETSRLFRAVASALAQSVPVQKIIVIDDGSTEDTLRLLRAELLTNSKVHLVELEHSGHPGVARKEGIRLSTADWVAFLDADDVWLFDKIEKQLQCAAETKAEAVYGNALKVENGLSEPFQPRERVPTLATVKNLLQRNFIVNSSVIVRRSALISSGLYSDSPGVRGTEDYATWLRLATNHKFVGIPDATVEYHMSGISLSKIAPVSARRNAITDWMRWITTARIPTLNKLTNLSLGALAIIGEQRNLVSLSIRAWLSKRSTPREGGRAPW